MAVRKLSEDSGSVVVRLPKAELRERGLFTDDGERYVCIDETEDGGGWEVRLLDL